MTLQFLLLMLAPTEERLWRANILMITLSLLCSHYSPQQPLLLLLLSIINTIIMSHLAKLLHTTLLPRQKVISIRAENNIFIVHQISDYLLFFFLSFLRKNDSRVLESFPSCWCCWPAKKPLARHQTDFFY